MALTVTSNDNTTFRPLSHFPPSIWGDRFIQFSLDQSALEAYAETIEGLKKEVRGLLTDTTIDSTKKLNMIYSIHHLGLSYHFEEEIDGQLEKLFGDLNKSHYEEVDLYTTSIHFQTFRHHGFKMSSDVFNKFKDNNTGKFKEIIVEDVKGMLSLYEATQLRVRGEEILDEALEFSQAHLKKTLQENNLSTNLAKQVHQALKRPFHRGMPILEARLYLSTHEQDSSMNETLLKLAKFHFNYLQLLYKEELRIVSKWWKDLGFPSKLTYIKDRVPETYFWSIGLYYEPRYSLARIILTKYLLLIVVIDDTYDAYGTIEELRLFSDAVNRWDVGAVDQLPQYMRFLYGVLLNLFDEFEEKLAKEGRSYAFHPSKQATQELVRGYHVEAEWFSSGYVAPFDEYMKVALVTSAYHAISVFGFAVMGEIANEEAFAWHKSRPLVLRSSEIISRLQDDIVTSPGEKEKGQVTSGIDYYMKAYGVSEEETILEYKKRIENAWKDINAECLKPTAISMKLLIPFLNLVRVIDVVYKYDDGLTQAEKILKDDVTLLFLTPVPIEG
uniref:germacrene-A synthase n=1 Tax=Aralia cordata TaxID=29746 RepID=A0A2Z6G169_ARACO|nr:germacrene A synthase [Aralia cordata]